MFEEEPLPPLDGKSDTRAFGQLSTTLTNSAPLQIGDMTAHRLVEMTAPLGPDPRLFAGSLR